MKFSLRLFLCITIILSVSFAGYAYWLAKELRSQYSETIEDSLSETSKIFSAYLTTKISEDELNTEGIDQIFANFNQLSSQVFKKEKKITVSQINVYVTDQNGIVIFDSYQPSRVGADYSKWNDVYLSLKGEYGARSTRSNPKDSLSSVYYVASPIVVGAKIIGVVSVFKPESSLRVFVKKSRKRVLLMTLFVLLISISVSALFALWLSRPIKILIEYARSIEAGKSVHPPKMKSLDFDKLGKAFDKMRIALEGKQTIEKYVQHLSHELKSPLTSIRAASELLRDSDMSESDRTKFLNNIENEANRAKNQLDELLEIASLESLSLLPDKQSFALEEILLEIEESLSAQVKSKELSLAFEAEALETKLVGNRALLIKVFHNLILNAVDFSPAGGVIAVTAKRTASFKEIHIVDQGIGVPDFAKTKIFEKFYSSERPETKRKSSGLGLSLVAEAVSLHGGSVRLEPREGKVSGAHFVVSLPL